jgi:hypothetical protein
MPDIITAYRSRYTGKLYSQESACLQDEFEALKARAKSQLDGFMLHRNATRRSDDKFSDLWNTLKQLRQIDADFYEALGAERLEHAENVVQLVRGTPADTLQEPAEEATANE